MITASGAPGWEHAAEAAEPGNMDFITTGDIDVQIRSNMLTEIIGTDTSLLDKAEAATILKVREHLKDRYDIDTELAKTGTDRNELLVMYMVDMMLYDLHSRINPRKIPELRRTRYKEAMEWLKMTKEGHHDPELDPKVDADSNTDGTDKLRWGSNEKREHYR